MKRQDDDSLTMKERALVALLREMVERMHPLGGIPDEGRRGSGRDHVVLKDLKHYRRRALNILRGTRHRVRIPAR